MTLDGQKIVVIGGSSGMGLAQPGRRRAEGAEVTIASSQQDRVDAALGELPAGCAAQPWTSATRPRSPLVRDLGELDHLAFTAGDAFAPCPSPTSHSAKTAYSTSASGAP